MEIKTKANIGDEVFYMKDNKINSGEIVWIGIAVWRKEKLYSETIEVQISYRISSWFAIIPILMFEEYIYLSKEELKDSL